MAAANNDLNSLARETEVARLRTELRDLVTRRRELLTLQEQHNHDFTDDIIQINDLIHRIIRIIADYPRSRKTLRRRQNKSKKNQRKSRKTRK